MQNLLWPIKIFFELISEMLRKQHRHPERVALTNAKASKGQQGDFGNQG